MKKSALIISLVVTAFVLVVVGGVFYALKTPQTAKAAPVVETLAAPDPALPEEIQQREAAYQDLINQANSRLDQLQKENQALQQQVTSLEQTQAGSSAVTEITPEQAAQVAANFIGDGHIYSVEGVQVRGVPLYQVTFSSGAIVYVSMDGQVVGSQAPLITSNNTPSRASRSEGGEHESGEHEGGGD